MNMKLGAGSLLCGIVASSLAMADCPNAMPEQLLLRGLLINRHAVIRKYELLGVIVFNMSANQRTF